MDRAQRSPRAHRPSRHTGPHDPRTTGAAQARGPRIQPTTPPTQAARSSWVVHLRDHRVVLGVAALILIVSVASLTVRVVVASGVAFRGTVVDARTRQPIIGAHVVAMGIHERSFDGGAFTVADVPRGTKLRFSADGYHYRDVNVTGERTIVALEPMAATAKGHDLPHG